MSAVAVMPPGDPSRLAAGVLSAVVHLLLVLMLIFGVNWQSKRPEAVSVELWQQLPEAIVEPEKPVRAPEPKPEIKPEPPKPEIKPPPPKSDPAPPRKPDIAIEKEKAAPKAPPLPPPPRLERLDLDRQLKEQAARELETVERERERREALAQFKPAPAPAASAATKGDPGYADRVIARIKPLIVLPPGIVGNPEAIFDVEQLPTGEVTTVKLRRSTGNAALDDAVDRAIHKASPLPRPAAPDSPPRSFALRFRPLEK